MNVLPYRRIVFQSSLAPDEVARVLVDSVDPKPRWDAQSRPFAGSVTPPEFRIYRTISYRNSFLPEIIGQIAPDGSGSRISMTLGLHPAVASFLALWLGIVAVIGVVVAVAGLVESHPIAFAPVGMFLFGYLLTMGSFSFEVRKAKEILLPLLEGTELALDARERPRAAYR